MNLERSNSLLKLVDRDGNLFGGWIRNDGTPVFGDQVGLCPNECSILSMEPLEDGNFTTHDDKNLRIHSEDGDVSAELDHENLVDYIYMKRFGKIVTNGGGECKIWSMRKLKERIRNSPFIPKIQKYEISVPCSYITIAPLNHHNFLGTLSMSKKNKKRGRNYFNVVNIPKNQVMGSDFGLSDCGGIYGKVTVIKSYYNMSQIFAGISNRTSPCIRGLDLRSQRGTHSIKGFGGDIRSVSHLELNDNYIFIACTDEKRTKFLHSTVKVNINSFHRDDEHSRRSTRWRRRRRFKSRMKRGNTVKRIHKVKREGRSRIACYDLRKTSQHLFRKYLPKTLVRKVESVIVLDHPSSLTHSYDCGDDEDDEFAEQRRLLFLCAEKNLVSYNPSASLGGNRKTVVKLSSRISQFFVDRTVSYPNNSRLLIRRRRREEEEDKLENYCFHNCLDKHNSNFLKIVDEGVKDMYERVGYLLELENYLEDHIMSNSILLRNSRKIFFMYYIG